MPDRGLEQGPTPPAEVKPSASLSQERQLAVVLGTEELKRIAALMEEATHSAVSIEAAMAHGLDAKFATVEQLAEYKNPQGKEIRKLEMRASARGSEDASVKVLLDSDRYSESVSVHASGLSRDEAEAVVNGVYEVIARSRAWYTWLWRPPLSAVAHGVIIITFGLAAGRLLASLSAPGYLLQVGLVAGAIGGASFWPWLRQRMFPRLRVLVGDEKKNWESKRTQRMLRWVMAAVLLPFVLSVAASIVAAWITD